MTPKSLLRHPKVQSTIEDLAEGSFKELITDNSINADSVKRLVFCSGKFYYELLQEREKLEDKETALIRLEQMYPLPTEQIEAELKKYKNAEKVIWAQEEPANMGAWTFMLWRFPVKLELVSPKESASPAAGSHKTASARMREAIENVFKS